MPTTFNMYIYNWVAWNQFFVPTDNFDWCYNWLNDASNTEQIQGEWIKKHEIAMQFNMIFSWKLKVEHILNDDRRLVITRSWSHFCACHTMETKQLKMQWSTNGFCNFLLNILTVSFESVSCKCFVKTGNCFKWIMGLRLFFLYWKNNLSNRELDDGERNIPR